MPGDKRRALNAKDTKGARDTKDEEYERPIRSDGTPRRGMTLPISALVSRENHCGVPVAFDNLAADWVFATNAHGVVDAQTPPAE